MICIGNITLEVDVQARERLEGEIVKIKGIVLNLLFLAVIASGGYLLATKGLSGAFAKNDSEKTTGQKTSGDIEAVKRAIIARLQQIDGTIDDISVEETPVEGVYWVLLPGNQMLLMSADGRYVLGSTLAELTDKEMVKVDSSIQATAAVEKKDIAKKGFEATQGNQIVFKAEGEKKGEVYVFTDVHCGYCKKFHQDVPNLNKAGIDVHYLAGPFFSRDRESLEKVWCSANPQEALSMAKFQDKLDAVSVTEQCKQIVTDHITLGQKLGIRGTPATFTKDGEQLGGYVPPDQLIAKITGNSAQ